MQPRTLTAVDALQRRDPPQGRVSDSPIGRGAGRAPRSTASLADEHDGAPDNVARRGKPLSMKTALVCPPGKPGAISRLRAGSGLRVVASLPENPEALRVSRTKESAVPPVDAWNASRPYSDHLGGRRDLSVERRGREPPLLKKTRVVVLAAVVAVLAATSTASAKVIDTARSNGDFAVAVASGTAKNPNWIKVRVRGADSTTSLFAVVACSRGFSSIGSKGYDRKGNGTFTLRMPLRNPDRCDITASGGGKGPLVVTILAG